MQTVSTDQLVGQTIGHYVVKSLLGRGRLSAVYLAQHPAQKHAVALTTFIMPDHFTSDMRTRFTQRFTREAATLTSLSHRNLLPIHEYGEQFDYSYLVTPYMTNGSLADVLQQQGRCTPTYVLEVLEQVAAGLDYAYRKGVVHGTLKPANILLGTDQNLLVAGFGLVHMLQMRGIEQNDQPYSYLLSIADTFLYASTYIAPEVVQGQPIDSRSDIYALGIMLFELLSGKPPFTGTSPLDTAMQHVQHPLPSLHKLSPDIPIALELVINHALARDPAQRFQRVSELVEAFSQVCKGSVSRPLYSIGSDDSITTNGTKSSRDLRHVHEEEISMGGTQFTAPVVTGKFAAFRSSNENVAASPNQMISTSNTDSWQILPPIITGHIAAVRPSQQLPAAKPTVQPPSARPIASSQQQVPTQQNRTSSLARDFAPATQQQQNVVLPVPSVKRELFLNDDDAMKTPTWWIQAPSPLAAQPAQGASEGPLRLPDPELQKSLEQSNKIPSSDTIMRIRPVAKRSRGMGRRRAIATIAAGGVVAAGALVVTKLNLLHLARQQAPTIAQQHGGMIAPTMPKQTNNGGKTNGGTTNKGTSGNKTNGGNGTTGRQGTVLGNTNLAVNSAIAIVDPADGKASLLIHLPNGNFVAYERACTHVGVSVNYDPATHTLVCPAHGSVFDPAKNAAVLQGPAMRPLKPVALHVNADGTITAG